MRLLTSIVGLALLIPLAFAQGPVFTQADLWTLDYEDFSDVLRRYPGMYPLDYGWLGNPTLFRPWHLNPWELQVEKDLIPQNRRGDGIFDSNLQPASELDTIRYNFLSGQAAGEFHLQSRALPVDTPYSEFQIREGWHGHGTVDFAHGQRVYRSLTLELTGRLSWYTGWRDETATRGQHLRGRVGFDLNPCWRAGVTYAGSNMDGLFPNASGPYSEREEGIFSLDQKDSARTAFNPSVRLYVRQDRENWGEDYHVREGVGGWVAQAHAKAPRQQFMFKHVGSYAELDYPVVSELYETSLEMFAQDSIDLNLAGVRVFGSIEGNAVTNDPKDDAWQTLPAGGVEAHAKLVSGLTGFGGLHYVKELWPVAWAHQQYQIENRPLLFSPEFNDTSLSYVGKERGEDRYRKTLAGLRWQDGRTNVELVGMMVDRYGEFAHAFINEDSIVTSRDAFSADDAGYGVHLAMQIPLRYGLRFDSWGSAQFSEQGEREEARAFSRLYFERDFFSSPLTIRSHISYEYIGQREVGLLVSSTGSQRAANLIGFRLSATIKGVTLIWGTENFFKQHYSLVPGYQMISKEEYIGVIWRLWL